MYRISIKKNKYFTQNLQLNNVQPNVKIFTYQSGQHNTPVKIEILYYASSL